MKFRQIEAFRYIMLRGTTAAAAAEMHVTQPAVSRLISDLEHSLGFLLFERRKGRLHPTHEAAEFFRSVEESFLGLEKLQSVAAHIRTRAPKELKIASTSAIASTLLPLALSEHKKYFPNERIVVHTDGMAEIVMKLQTNSVDLAVGLQLPQLSGIEQEFIGNARFVFAARHDHPLTRKSVITAEDLIGESVLTVLDSNPTYWSKLGQALEPVETKVSKQLFIDTSHTGYSMIAAGLAVGVLEPFAARVWAANGVVTRPFEPAIYYPYNLAYPTNTRHHKSLHSFTESIKNAAKSMPEIFEAQLQS
ncbi:LysR family transcriptional regulator [Photobacterium sp. TY1-4]|uniref:LysR family transcriptional regulator n=1 Tax=Photobacterium sp. TY1-4 TaxID=2899122 RepID=UPI0021C072A1|nr:LysR substrate-binding domain-containing protein [Photobacterium sp. TY1-4]UXI03365.1 LysR substrate-binding domain-containing protein [Photobacterium sp. TY1-4]